MRNFTLFVCSVLCFSLISLNSSAQCPTPTGMTATPLTLNGNCYFFIQFAIPNSNVSIYNSGGYVAQGTANAGGAALIAYSCTANPITGVLSLDGVSGNSCTVVTISTPATLPVRYTSFTSQIVSQGVLLKWSTSLEINNDKYIIEKSKDGVNYQPVGEIAGSGNSTSDKHYSFTDNMFRKGDAAYYRIRQVDLDGRSEYSKVVFVNDSKSGSQSVKLFPNPFRGDDAIQITGVSAADMNRGNIQVFSVTGAQVRYEISGSNAIQLDPSAPSGLYVVRILNQSYRLMKK